MSESEKCPFCGENSQILFHDEDNSVFRCEKCERRFYKNDARIIELQDYIVGLEAQLAELNFILDKFETWNMDDCPGRCPFEEKNIASEVKDGGCKTREEAREYILNHYPRLCAYNGEEGQCWIEYYRNIYRQGKQQDK